jgi:hypothetical protein
MAQPNIFALQPVVAPLLRTEGTALKHVIESQQFTVPLLMELFERSQAMERIVARGGHARLPEPHPDNSFLHAFDPHPTLV